MRLKMNPKFLGVKYNKKNGILFPCLDLRKNFGEMKWLDFKLVENLFRILDAVWPEIFPIYTSFLYIFFELIMIFFFNLNKAYSEEEIQKKLANLLDFINANEYAKDMEVLINLYINLKFDIRFFFLKHMQTMRL